MRGHLGDPACRPQQGRCEQWACGIWEQPFTERVRTLPRTHLAATSPRRPGPPGPPSLLPPGASGASVQPKERLRWWEPRKQRAGLHPGQLCSCCQGMLFHASPSSAHGAQRGEIRALPLAHRCPPVGAVGRQHSHCSGLNGGPQKVRLRPRTYLEKGLCRRNLVKDLEMRPSWITQGSPKSNDKCPHKKRGDRTHGGPAHVKTETEAAAKEAWGRQELDEAGRTLPCRFQRERSPANTLTSDFQPPDVRE